jgi:hypothetical protein
MLQVGATGIEIETEEEEDQNYADESGKKKR